MLMILSLPMHEHIIYLGLSFHQSSEVHYFNDQESRDCDSDLCSAHGSAIDCVSDVRQVTKLLGVSAVSVIGIIPRDVCKGEVKHYMERA